MPRRARLRVAGLPLHIVQRGNNRSACFYTRRDYAVYLRHLQELAPEYACAIHAYVLMTNHVHLLLTPEREDGPSLMMKHLGQRYVQYVNRTYARTGTLWEGRFRSSIVERQNYLLRCYRYIEMNPVRAGMVHHPRDYPWSSYRSNAEGQFSRLLTPHDEFFSLGQSPEGRCAAYRSLFESQIDFQQLQEIRLAVNGGFALGSKRFRAQIAEELGRRVERGTPGRPPKQDGTYPTVAH